MAILIPSQQVPVSFTEDDAVGLTGLLPSAKCIDLEDNLSGLPKTERASTKTEFVRKSDHFITPYNGKFYYYPLRIAEDGDHLFRLLGQVPNVVREGFFVRDRVVYFVTVGDLQRRVIRKSRRMALPNRLLSYEEFQNGTFRTTSTNTNSNSTNSDPASASDSGADCGGDPSAASARGIAELLGISAPETGILSPTPPTGGSSEDTNIQGPGGSHEVVEERRLADLAFEEQISSLFGLEDSEEEWVVENNS